MNSPVADVCSTKVNSLPNNFECRSTDDEPHPFWREDASAGGSVPALQMLAHPRNIRGMVAGAPEFSDAPLTSCLLIEERLGYRIRTPLYLVHLQQLAMDGVI